MSLDLSALDRAPRLLLEIPLRPVQGQRFQPTGFPGLGAATFQAPAGTCLLVESAQSMANRLELTCWDEAANDLKPEFQGLSHVRVARGKGSSEAERRKSQEVCFFTDSITEAHRLNSPYIMFAKHNSSDVFDALGESLNAFEIGPLPSRSEIAQFFLHWDIGTLLHGTFLSAKKGKDKTLAGGRLRIPRALSAFIEADGVVTAASGGVKNDHVNPQGDTKLGFGNVPFARDEFTAERIKLYVNLDLSQIRGYGLGTEVERMLILLALYKLRLLLDGSLRLRTACDLNVATESIAAGRPKGFTLPDAAVLRDALTSAIATCSGRMTATEVRYDSDLRKGKSEDDEQASADDDNGGD
jgi:CRISPR-associated protein Csb1